MTLFFTEFKEAVVIDVETTGFDPETDRIVSVAMIRTNFGDLRKDPNSMNGETIEMVINPQVSIPQAASRVHGITDRDVADKDSFSDISQSLRDFIGDLPIIAHNVSFDKRFLSAEFKRAGVKTLSRNQSYCTMRRFQHFNHGRRRGSKLEDVVEVLGIEGRMSYIHHAVEDAKMAWKVARQFYMMDNRIKAPGGKPTRPSRNGQIDFHDTSKFQNSDSGVDAGTLIVVITLIVLLILLLY